LHFKAAWWKKLSIFFIFYTQGAPFPSLWLSWFSVCLM
jgi:hypothetical protein